MNTFYHGDCLFVMTHDILPETVDLIYLDPPFFTGKIQKAKSRWHPDAMEISYNDSRKFWGEKTKDVQENAPEWLKHIAIKRPDFAAYLYYMMVRLQACHRVLKRTGSIYLHCDWRASHYLKMIMDEIFEDNHFQNEITWHYKGRGMQKSRFQRKHDTIFYYSKTQIFLFNSNDILVPLDPTHTGRYNKTDEHGKKYALIKKGHSQTYSQIYLKDGIVPDDVWDIPFIHGRESVGYPTQKPVTLLERIIKASSNEEDLVLDPFCGCGTAIIVAHKLNRQWIGIDINKIACEVTQVRGLQMPLGMQEEFAEFHPISRDLKEILKLDTNDFERWVNEFYKATKPHPDRGIDGVTPDGIGIQTKTNRIDYTIISRLVEDARHHPATIKPIKKIIAVSQIGFDDTARQRKYAVEHSGGIEITLATPEDMLTLKSKEKTE